MTVRPDERRTARDYARLLGGKTVAPAGLRLLAGAASTYLLNAPIVAVPEEIRLRPHHRVLDIGCGDGGPARLLAQRAGLAHDPVGVDISPAMLRLAARGNRGSNRVELAAAAATRLPFAGASFDLVVASYLFRQLQDDTLYRVLLEAHRVLNPGGVLLAWEFAPTSSQRLNRFHRWLLTRAVRDCHLRGFGALLPYAYYTGFSNVQHVQFNVPFLFPPIPRVILLLQKASESPEAVAPGPSLPCMPDGD